MSSTCARCRSIFRVLRISNVRDFLSSTQADSSSPALARLELNRCRLSSSAPESTPSTLVFAPTHVPHLILPGIRHSRYRLLLPIPPLNACRQLSAVLPHGSEIANRDRSARAPNHHARTRRGFPRPSRAIHISQSARNCST